jgi:hypothetical protein
VSLPENTSGWTLLNDPLLYDLPIFKEDSETGAKLGGAGFTVYYNACDAPLGGPVGPEQFTGPGDAVDGSAGRTIFTDLPTGDYCVVETTVPDGYTGSGPFTVSLPENTSGWTFLNDPIPTGTLELLKWFCTAVDEEDAGTYFFANPGGIDCVYGAASFYVYEGLDGDPIGPITTDPVTGQDSIDLAPGDYTLQEIGSGATTGFSIESGETTTIPVYNLIFDEGALNVTKFFCKSKHDATDISFDYPVDVSAAGWWGDHKSKCWRGDASFEVWLYGDPYDAISFHTGKDGEVWLILPATTDATGPHKLVETDTGASAWFDILAGETTYATVTNFFKAHHPHPHPVVTPTPTKTVTELPATGSGSSGASSWYLLGVAVVGMAGLAGIALRRKPNGR